ncbi:MAG: prolyl oligopeptidase family serine peptidase [bacterium]|nr:prolyl oligopeptidase family serine peptidase [bacterium]
MMNARILTRFSIWFAVILIASSAFADVQLQVTPDHEDWVYDIAEPVTFKISLTSDGQPVKSAKISYQIGPEQMPLFQEGSLDIENGSSELNSYGLDRPGFLRCTVYAELDGKRYRGLATAAYQPDRIQPASPMPDDFDSYWKGELEKLEKVPLEPVLTPLPEYSNDKVDAYHVSYVADEGGWRGSSRFYGMLAVPKGDGPFPALLQVPGAGVRAYRPQTYWAERGVIHLTVGIHGIPVNLPDELYNSLGNGALKNYFFANLDDRDQYYYHRVFLGCARAVDFIFQLDKFDGKTLGIHGGSQGGALSITTAALEPRIRFVASTYPAMCDHYGYLEGRAGGWPHLFKSRDSFNFKEDKFKTALYYDVVNFARRLTVPVLMGFGYNDETCPPTSMYAAYNSIPSDKELQIVQRMGHGMTDEHARYADQWLVKHLKGE